MPDHNVQMCLILNGVFSFALVPSFFVFWLYKKESLPYAWVLWFYMLLFTLTGCASVMRFAVPSTEYLFLPFITFIRGIMVITTAFAVQRLTRWPGPSVYHLACKEMASTIGHMSERMEH